MFPNVQENTGSKLIESTGSLFFGKCEAAYSAEKYSLLLELFVSKMDVLYGKASNDQDLECAINIICHLVRRIHSPGMVDSAALLSQAIAAEPKSRADRRLQALVNLYNVVLDTQAKLVVLLQTLQFSKASGLADVMLGVVRAHVDSWPNELSLTPSDERKLYVTCADALKSCTRKPRTAAKESYRLLCKYLATWEGSTPQEASGAVEVSSQVVSDFIRSPDMFQFDLAGNPAIAALKENSKYSPLHQLMTIYLGGGVADFEKFAETNKAFFKESLGITSEAAFSKMRLLALMGLAYGAKELSFASIASNLNVSPSEVEALVVQAIGKKLIEARIDQLKEEVVIGKCAARAFGTEQWKELQIQLRSWQKSVGDVLELGRDEKGVLAKGIAELSVSA